MILPKSSNIKGPWINKSNLKSGDVIKFVSEPIIEEGPRGPQLVAQVLVKGGEKEAKNLGINKPSQRALTEAFGEDTLKWMNKPFVIEIEKTIVSGKRGIALYVIPEGFELGEDNGYVVIVKTETKEQIADRNANENYPTEDIKPEDIPF